MKCVVVMEPWEPLVWEYGTTSRTERVQRSQLLLKSAADLLSGLSGSKIWLSCKPNFVASWIHLHHCRCFLEHLRMLLQSLRAHCKTPGGAGSIWKYLKALARATGVSGRFAFGCQTKLHFVYVCYPASLKWVWICSLPCLTATIDVWKDIGMLQWILTIYVLSQDRLDIVQTTRCDWSINIG